MISKVNQYVKRVRSKQHADLIALAENPYHLMLRELAKLPELKKKFDGVYYFGDAVLHKDKIRYARKLYFQNIEFHIDEKRTLRRIPKYDLRKWLPILLDGASYENYDLVVSGILGSKLVPGTHFYYEDPWKTHHQGKKAILLTAFNRSWNDKPAAICMFGNYAGLPYIREHHAVPIPQITQEQFEGCIDNVVSSLQYITSTIEKDIREKLMIK